MQDRHPEGHPPGELPLAWARSGTVVTSAARAPQAFLRAQVGWVLWWERGLRAVRTRPGVAQPGVPGVALRLEHRKGWAVGPGERPGWDRGPEVRNKVPRDLGFVPAGGEPEGEAH